MYGPLNVKLVYTSSVDYPFSQSVGRGGSSCALGGFVGFSQYTAYFYIFYIFLYYIYIKIGCVLTETYKTP